MRHIAFDTETTGLDPNSGHRVIELGCVEVFDKSVIGESFHAYINPQRDVPYASTAIHGLTSDMLRDKPVFADVIDDFLDFIGNDQLVIHNAAFDMKFMNAELGLLNRDPIPFSRAIDTLNIARRKFPGSKATLDALCNRFDISLKDRSKHGALIDAQLLGLVYIELSGGKQSAMNLAADTTEKSASFSGKGDLMQHKQARVFPISEEEKKAHSAFIANLSDPLWEKV